MTTTIQAEVYASEAIVDTHDELLTATAWTDGDMVLCHDTRGICIDLRNESIQSACEKLGLSDEHYERIMSWLREVLD